MMKLMTPLLLTAFLLAENTPSLNEQLHAIDAAQADMFSDFEKIKKKREIEELKAEKIEEQREKENLAKKEEEKRLAEEKLKEDEAKRVELAHQNALKKIEEDKKKAEALKAKQALEKEKALKASKLAEAKKKVDAKKKSDYKKRAAVKRKVIKKKKSTTVTHKVKEEIPTTTKETSSLETLNALLHED